MHVEIELTQWDRFIKCQTDIDTLLGMITPTLEHEESPMITAYLYGSDETMIENKDAGF